MFKTLNVNELKYDCIMNGTLLIIHDTATCGIPQ